MLGEDVPMSVQVIAGSSPVTVGSVFLAQDGAQIAQLTPDANGKVSFTASSGSLSLGAHTFQALYAAGDGYASSSSSVITLTVFANAPALSLTLSTSTLNVSYRATSPAVAVQIASQYGAAGAVTLSCSGLPIGMTCNFAPAQATIAAGGSASATLTIGSTANSASAVSPNGSGKSAAIALSVPLIALLGVCRGHRRVAQMLGLGMLAIIVSSLTACGGSPRTKPTQETGTKTVLVNATSGSITQSTPLILNIQ